MSLEIQFFRNQDKFQPLSNFFDLLTSLFLMQNLSEYIL